MFFTPKRTIGCEMLPILNPAYTWEAHLMAQNPEDYFLDLQIAGFDDAIFHFESCIDSARLPDFADKLREIKIRPGLGINIETPVDSILPFVSYFDYLLLLGVHPGFQGQKIDERVFEKLKLLRNHAVTAKITVDGGIKQSNASMLSELGADFLVVGSALFETERLEIILKIWNKE